MATIVDQVWLKDGLSTRMDAGIITHNESTIIEFSQVVSTGPEAIRDSGFQEGQEHRDNFDLFLNGSIDAEVLDETNGTTWRFDLEYTTDGFNLSNSPGTQQRAFIEIGTWTKNIVVESDKETNTPILNSAGDPFDPAPEEIIAAPVLRVTLIQGSANIKRVEDIGSINKAKVKIAGIEFPKYCAMLADYNAAPSYDEDGNVTFRNTYTIKGNFKVNRDGDLIGFKMEQLNQGFNQMKDGVKQAITIKEPKDPEADPIKYNNVPISQPQLLDENGEATGTESYSEFVVHKTVSFSSFKLPTNFPVN